MAAGDAAGEAVEPRGEVVERDPAPQPPPAPGAPEAVELLGQRGVWEREDPEGPH